MPEKDFRCHCFEQHYTSAVQLDMPTYIFLFLEEDHCAEIDTTHARQTGFYWRGLTMVTGLPVITSKQIGRVGLQCSDEEMALWLLRAIVIENVCVRREGSVLWLPAGPAFQLEKESKNVITVVAKTYHYWTEHVL